MFNPILHHSILDIPLFWTAFDITSICRSYKYRTYHIENARQSRLLWLDQTISSSLDFYRSVLILYIYPLSLCKIQLEVLDMLPFMLDF
jgi:hypothetical protein